MPLGPASIESVPAEMRCLPKLEAPACNSRSGASYACLHGVTWWHGA